MAHWATLRDLVRIIPVAQSQTRGDATLTLLSIDCYADGWVTNLRVHHPDPHYFPVFLFHPKPDKRRAYQYGGGYGIDPWRYDDVDPNCYFSSVWIPPLNPEPVPLEFVVDVVRFTDRPRKEGGILMAEIWGPWRFEVDPAGGNTAMEREPPTSPGPVRNGEFREQRQEQTMPVYGPVFDTLLDIFYRYDPYGIAWLDPSGAEWYAAIMVNILHGLSYARSAQNVADILVYEFHHRWNFDIQKNPRFEQFSNEVWEAWQREGRVAD